jgi:hypothetical protein
MVGGTSATGKRAQWTAERRERFLHALGESGNVRLAAQAAGQACASGAYVLRHRDPEFAAAWDRAVADAVARIEGALVARALAEIEARNAELEQGHAGEGLSFDQMMKLLTYYRSAQARPVRGGPKRQYASREQTDASLNAALDALGKRVRARKQREAAARKALRLGGGQEVVAKGRR